MSDLDGSHEMDVSPEGEPAMEHAEPEYYHCVGIGWKPLIDGFLDYCQRRSIGDITIGAGAALPSVPEVSFKEKWGRLRVEFWSGTTEDILDFAYVVEHLSGFLCEWCGQPGRTRYDQSWYKTLCDVCHAQR